MVVGSRFVPVTYHSVKLASVSVSFFKFNRQSSSRRHIRGRLTYASQRNVESSDFLFLLFHPKIQGRICGVPIIHRPFASRRLPCCTLQIFTCPVDNGVAYGSFDRFQADDHGGCGPGMYNILLRLKANRP